MAITSGPNIAFTQVYDPADGVKNNRLGLLRFHNSIVAAKNARPTHGMAVDTPTDYRGWKDHKLFLSPNGEAGYAVSPNGELSGVFKHPDAKGPEFQDAAAKAATHASLVGGATWLSAFDDPTHKLPTSYAKARFSVRSRLQFNPDYKPEGWDMEKQGTPDVVFMGLTLDKKRRGNPNAGVTVDDYDAAVAKTRADVRRSQATTDRNVRKQFGTPNA